MKGYLLFTLVFITIKVVIGKQGFGPTDQNWGFVEVREKASIFWWLHYTTAQVSTYTNAPLILWLQGGPGSSSTGYGNFAELGPLDTDLNPRDTTWVQYANILFVDSPVGTGFSFVKDKSLLTTNNTQIAIDFNVFLREFFTQNPEFQTVPFYIFSESYGGKMVVEITTLLLAEKTKGNIKCNLRAIALGDSAISLADNVVNYAPYLLDLGIIDQEAFHKMDKLAQLIPSLVDEGKYLEAFGLWRGVEYEIKTRTYGVDMYNILNKKISDPSASPDYPSYNGETGVDPNAESKIKIIMNTQVREALNISRPWGTQNEPVFDALTGEKGDFMAPVIHIVEDLLNNTDIKIAVYTAQLDLIVNTRGTIAWMNKMNWIGKVDWDNTERNAFQEGGFYQGYKKSASNLSLYWVDRSGHMVPADNPDAMLYILKEVTNNFIV